MTDSFDDLLEFSFRGISAPLISFSDQGSQDMPEHKKADRDGSSSEGTGRNPYLFVARIPFINGLRRAPQETWDDLYPQQYSAMLKALEDRTSGDLQHPERGVLSCVALSWHSELSADTRGGRILEVQFREHDDDTATLADASDFTSLSIAASTLETTLGDLSPPMDLETDDGMSLSELAGEIAAIADTPSLLENNIMGKINSMIASVNKITDAFSGAVSVLTTAPTLATLDIATTPAPIGNGGALILPLCAQVVAALYAAQKQILAQDKPTSFYMTQVPLTLPNLALQLKSSVQDLVTLNPFFKGPIIPAQTLVRYYSS